MQKNWTLDEILGGSSGEAAPVESSAAPAQSMAPIAAGKNWTVDEILGEPSPPPDAQPAPLQAQPPQERRPSQAPQKNWTLDEILAPTPALAVVPTGGAGPGSRVTWKDPLWDSAEVQAAKRTGVPVAVIRAIRMHGERSNANQVSPAGAKGVYQFMPTTRGLFLKKYGVDAYSGDPVEQAMAAAYHLKESYQRTGSWLRAAAGYNGGIPGERGTNKTTENRNYVARIAAAPGMRDYL